MKQFFIYMGVFGCLTLGILPLVSITTQWAPNWLTIHDIVGLNLMAWIIVAMAYIARFRLSRLVDQAALAIGLPIKRDSSIESIFRSAVDQIERMNACMGLNLVERRVESKEDFSRTLQRIVSLAVKVLNAESAELALFDKESGIIHSSFVLGKPFSRSAQAMLAGAVEGNEARPSPDVMIQPIAFAGTVLGTLRVALKNQRVPSAADRELIRLLALQGGLAVVNSQYTEELMRIRQLSEDSLKAKTGFLANLSHEIRGPLGIIINAVELVVDGLCGDVTQDQLETLKMVQSNGEHLLELINDVLDYAKVESGRIKVTPAQLDVNDLLKDLTGVVRTQAEAKKHLLSANITDEMFGVVCDRRHFRQILINLLTNAIKYTPDKGRIDVWAERAPGNKVKICVKDSGIGIEDSQKHKVFAAFERVEHSYAMAQMGTGLGMPLTKRLAEVNGGTVDFISKPGQGSTFWVQLPAAEPNELGFKEPEMVQPDAKGAGERVLVLQREDGERGMMVRYLRHIGFAPVAAATREEAALVLREQRVSVAIIDNGVVDSPDENIVDVVRKIASNEQLPVVLVTSRAFVFDIEKYLRAGVDRCLVKPIQLKDLGHTTRSLIDGVYSGDVIDRSELQDKIPNSKLASKPGEVLH